MARDQYSELDFLAAPNGYVAAPTAQDISYLTYFRQVCKRYNINFAEADSDEREFVIHMAEKGFYPLEA